MQSDNVCLGARPTGGSTALASVIGYLKEAGPRRAYMAFRTRAGR